MKGYTKTYAVNEEEVNQIKKLAELLNLNYSETIRLAISKLYAYEYTMKYVEKKIKELQLDEEMARADYLDELKESDISKYYMELRKGRKD